MSYLQDTFVQLVKINSPSGKEAEIVQFLKKKLAEFGCEATSDTYGNILCTKKGVGEPLLLAAHVDTVLPTDNIQVKFEKGRFFTDQTTILGADDKAGVAILLDLLRELCQENVPHRTIEVLLVVQEEVGLKGSQLLDYSKIKSKEGINLDSHDPVGQVNTKAPAYFAVDVAITGTEAHAGAAPEKGVNALKVFADGMAQLDVGKLAADLTFNMAIIEAGQARNVVPGTVAAKGEIRSFSENKLNRQFAKVKKAFERAARQHGAKVKVTGELETRAYQIAASRPLVRQFKKAAESQGLTFAVNSCLGASDANIYNANGVAVFDMGLNYKDIHSVKESIRLRDMERAVALLKGLILQK